MITLYERLNKAYDKKIIEHKKIKKLWKSRKENLIEIGIKVATEDDTTYFQYEIIEQSLAIKTRFEDVFFETYVAMYDYWYDLTYQERKKQMNIEIAKLKDELTYFTIEDQELYMPCFDVKFNHLYTDEIVLLDLKQYHTFIRTFATQIGYDRYGAQPFLNHFSSAHVIVQKGEDFILYHEIANRFYLYKQGHFDKALSLHPKKITDDEELMVAIAQAFLKEDEDELIELIVNSELISKRMIKKIKRYRMKKEKLILKKQQKGQKKNKQE